MRYDRGRGRIGRNVALQDKTRKGSQSRLSTTRRWRENRRKGRTILQPLGPRVSPSSFAGSRWGRVRARESGDERGRRGGSDHPTIQEGRDETGRKREKTAFPFCHSGPSPSLLANQNTQWRRHCRRHLFSFSPFSAPQNAI